MDEDSGSSSQRIAAFRFDAVQSVDSSRQQTLTLQGTSVAIDVTYTVHCAQNFQDRDCTRCISGFTGAMCDENIDDCQGRNCSGNGHCIDGINTFMCDCNPGFTGEMCGETDDCQEKTCSGNGQCIDGFNSFTCNCNPGFTGIKCEDNIDECIEQGVNCSGNGQCVDDIDSYSCNCSAGYSGTNCEINIDDCSPNPCGANGQCIDEVDSFTCNCTTGYTGTLCDSDIDECLSNPCGMNQN